MRDAMIGDFAEDSSRWILILLLVGGVAALGLSIPAARGALDRYGWPYAFLAVTVSAGLGWLILVAAGDDPYFAPDHLSRWEYASRNGDSPTVVTALVLALVSIVALATAARSTRHARLRRFMMPLAALASSGIVIAAAKLFLGH